MDRFVLRICMTLTMLATFAFTDPVLQSSKQNGSTSTRKVQSGNTVGQSRSDSSSSSTLGVDDRKFKIGRAHV